MITRAVAGAVGVAISTMLVSTACAVAPPAAPATVPDSSVRPGRASQTTATATPAATTTSAATTRTAATSTTADGEGSMATGFAALEHRLGGKSGIAWVSLGGHGTVHRAGTLHTGVAWSTAKVPVAIAVVRHDHGKLTSTDARSAKAAITRSDNDAALRLWARLGSGSAAAKATEQVLHDGGDSHTVVPTHRLRAGFTPFGQARWALTDQARFAAKLPCVAGSAPIRSLMGEIETSQSWGVGELAGTELFKGGWGPDAHGHYLVRQLAIVRLADGTRIGLALATEPADGRFASGTKNLGALARWARTHTHGVAHAGC